MLRPTAMLALVPTLILTACATPREACIASAQRDLRVLDQLIAETRANLQRGYALEERQEVVTLRERCPVPDANGDVVFVPCDRVETRTTQEPVAINLREEQATLNSLIERRDAQARATQTAVQQCTALHPE